MNSAVKSELLDWWAARGSLAGRGGAKKWYADVFFMLISWIWSYGTGTSRPNDDSD